MTITSQFRTGVTMMEPGEELFLSVTASFELGPGIQRDGLTAPRMTDPHTVPRLCYPIGEPAWPTDLLPPTANAWVQRAGTWTLYQHVKRFGERMPNWTITAVQSNGDLTMNPWHVAYLGSAHDQVRADGDTNGRWCGLMTPGDPSEPFAERVYRCLVKWNDAATKALGNRYEVIPLTFAPITNDWEVLLGPTVKDDDRFQTIAGYHAGTRDIRKMVEFVLAGKQIVEDGLRVSLPNAIHRFDDVRHIFGLPKVAAEGRYRGHEVRTLIFGEKRLSEDLNVRRAALSGAVIVGLNHLDGQVTVTWHELEEALKRQQFRYVSEAPTVEGQFSEYTPGMVEIFFPHNVFPFGVIGLRDKANVPEGESGLVTLASGGLSGRVGNTLEGITRVMFDFLGCADAMVLDEGFDVFALVNPKRDDGQYAYSSAELADAVLAFTRERLDEDAAAFASAEDDRVRAGDKGYALPGGVKGWPLNEPLVEEIEDRWRELQDVKDVASTDRLLGDDVFVVEPRRSQVRSVLIYAKEDVGTSGG